MARRILLALALCVAVLAAGEAGLHRHLFQHVSYSNSESIDAQLRERGAGPAWKLRFVGDSETRWGVDPEQVDAGYRDEGVRMLSFNHAFDGFGASWWAALLPHVLPRLTVTEDGEDFVVKVLGPDGKPSASTMDDFKKELLQNKDLAPILRGTRASGGGANGGAGGGGACSFCAG